MMITRRTLLGALPALSLTGPGAALAAASQPSGGPGFEMPDGACDCHVHVHPKGYPMAENRTYTPELAEVSELEALLEALGLARVVIVTPSIYGPDNSATLSGLHKLGNRARGVAVVDGSTGQRELDLLVASGVRGVRLNLSTGGVNDPDVARRMILETEEILGGRDLHLQLNTNLEMIAALQPFLQQRERMLVIDHFGGAQPKGESLPGQEALIALAQSGKAYVKLSIKGGGNVDLSAFDPLAQALIAANPDRMLWGTNWPHPNAAAPKGGTAHDLTPLHAVDDAMVLQHLAIWAPEAEMRRRILVENPARLYGF